MDNIDRSRDSLSSEFMPYVDQVLSRLMFRNELMMIIQTSRTPAQAAANLASGASATSHSKHLPRYLRWPDKFKLGQADADRCDAIDICPYEVYLQWGPDKLYWDDDAKAHPVFIDLCNIVESYPRLRSGQRWTKPHDPGHFELLFDGEHYPDIPETSAAYTVYGDGIA